MVAAAAVATAARLHEAHPPRVHALRRLGAAQLALLERMPSLRQAYVPFPLLSNPHVVRALPRDARPLRLGLLS